MAVLFLLVSDDYFLASELKVWGENITTHGIQRITAVFRVFVICKIAAWVIRTPQPCTTMMSQPMVVRWFSSSCKAIGSWLVLGGPEKPRGAMRAKPWGEIHASTTGKSATVYDKKYADQISFRGSAKAAKRNLEQSA